MIENYLIVLEDSLKKKLVVLEKIIQCDEEQSRILQAETIDVQQLDKNMDDKEGLIQELTALDDGFESLYSRIREQLQTNKSAYGSQIKSIQALIAKITEKSILIQTQETRNKKRIDDYLGNERSQIKKQRQHSKAAYDYYRSLSSTNSVIPQIMDEKH